MQKHTNSTLEKLANQTKGLINKPLIGDKIQRYFSSKKHKKKQSELGLTICVGLIELQTSECLSIFIKENNLY